MGLDLYHFKAVLDPALSLGSQHPWFFVEELAPEAFTEFGFDRYVQDVPDSETLHTVQFFANEDARRYAQARAEKEGTDPGSVTYLIGTPESRAADLSDLERRLDLDRDQSCRFDTQTRAQGFAYSATLVTYSKPILRDGIYTAEVGYQRKGMTHGFYEYFSARPAYVYVRPEDFQVVEQNMAPDLSEPVQLAIREKFTRSYEPGRSLLYYSW
ncbi:hypothetical protein [Nocardia sp. NPDC050406]|uniref:hypothetical protein n=1 Tax=Nocardia sp. NPDC050406 TaxID=3364318 RepID=UPI003796F4F2